MRGEGKRDLLHLNRYSPLVILSAVTRWQVRGSLVR